MQMQSHKQIAPNEIAFNTEAVLFDKVASIIQVCPRNVSTMMIVTILLVGRICFTKWFGRDVHEHERRNFSFDASYYGCDPYKNGLECEFSTYGTPSSEVTAGI